MKFLLLCVLAAYSLTSPIPEIREDRWGYVGSRTYQWNGSEVLRCRHWDKVSIRWHLSTCRGHHGDANCTGGSNEDVADKPQPHTEIPRWHDAFTFVQLPSTIDHHITMKKTSFYLRKSHHHHHSYLKFAVDGYDEKILKIRSIEPLKVDVQWKWSLDELGCNNFTIRMSALSTYDDAKRPQIHKFCKDFDKDGFLDCDNL